MACHQKKRISRITLLLVIFPSNWSQRDDKSPKVSRTLPSIVAVFSNTVVWMFLIRPQISIIIIIIIINLFWGYTVDWFNIKIT